MPARLSPLSPAVIQRAGTNPYGNMAIVFSDLNILSPLSPLSPLVLCDLRGIVGGIVLLRWNSGHIGGLTIQQPQVNAGPS